MNTQDLLTLISVARLGSFAAHARLQNTDPSLVSRTIALLETELGFRLFERTTRKISLTEAGQQYLATVTPLLEGLLSAADQARSTTARAAGHLRVTASVAFGNRMLVPLLGQFRGAYPDITVELIFTDAVVDLVADAIDVALRLSPKTDSGYVGQKLMDTQYLVCASPHYLKTHAHISSPRQLSDHQCLVFSLAGFRSRWRFRNPSTPVFDVSVRGSIMTTNALALRQAALDGLGPCLLSNWLVQDDIKQGHLVKLFPRYEVTATDFSTAVWVLYPSRKHLPAKTRAFIDFVRQHLGNARAK
jgi:DNA-binding transcriptional LysR family regulator